MKNVSSSFKGKKENKKKNLRGLRFSKGEIFIFFFFTFDQLACLKRVLASLLKCV